MPEDLRQKIIEAIAASGDENYKRLLMLLLRVEEVFLERVDALTEQMTVPAETHKHDHEWIAAARAAQGNVRSAAWKITVALAEKGALVAAGALAAQYLGGA